ncbi:MAG: cysteine desulfurase family protein [Candidatus Neomarinimicrobiota bacterium]
MIYLDYSATTPLDKRVSDLMNQVIEEDFGNPSSIHQMGQAARYRIEKARLQVANAINAEASEIIFTSSGSEANNLVLWDVIQRRGQHVIISSIEHPSVFETVNALKSLGLSVSEIGVDRFGRVRVDDIENKIKNETALVAIMTANNETGTIQPINDVAALCREKRVHFHTDAVQALGKIKVDLIENYASTATFSAHKIYGPKGSGALYIRKGKKLHPLVYGGGQEKSLRAGTENVPGIAGFGLACELVAENIKGHSNRVENLRDMMVKRIISEFPSAIINGHPEKHLPGVLSIVLPKIDAQALLIKLDLDGFAVSTGAACSSGTTKPSRSLLAMGLSNEDCQSTLRISIGRQTNDFEIESFLISLLHHVNLMMDRKKLEVAL